MIDDLISNQESIQDNIVKISDDIKSTENNLMSFITSSVLVESFIEAYVTRDYQQLENLIGQDYVVGKDFIKRKEGVTEISLPDPERVTGYSIYTFNYEKNDANIEEVFVIYALFDEHQFGGYLKIRMNLIYGKWDIVQIETDL